MIELTEKARIKLNEFLVDKEQSSVRITEVVSGCG